MCLYVHVYTFIHTYIRYIQIYHVCEHTIEKGESAYSNHLEGEEKGRDTKSPSILHPCGELTLKFLCSSPGQEYHVLTPKVVPRGSSTVSCPHCQPVRTQDTGKGWKWPRQQGYSFFSPGRGQSGQTWACPELGGRPKAQTREPDFSEILRTPRVSCPHTCCPRCCCLKPPSLTLTWRSHGRNLRSS